MNKMLFFLRIPNGIAAEHKVSCSTAFSRDAMMTPKQYQRLLQVSIYPINITCFFSIYQYSPHICR